MSATTGKKRVTIGGKKRLGVNVYEATLERIHYLFDNFPNFYVAFSGGKDSGVLLHLVIQEARIRNRLPIDVLIVDLEA
ncbi:hypothetical protein L1D34_29910 [Vibrio mediterranei]|uniref:hypothetical protein n=1 Tax=Vibrio mediterranei TaxID=689 RepID=UPI001EFE2FCA|nr:hypothetical protein [Vibrio mediterranei]MCG9629015.1 hypothetical protein [Vibrio mediterranei]